MSFRSPRHNAKWTSGVATTMCSTRANDLQGPTGRGPDERKTIHVHVYRPIGLTVPIMGGDLRGWGTVPSKFKVGTAHASVPQYLEKYTVMGYAGKYEVLKNVR